MDEELINYFVSVYNKWKHDPNKAYILKQFARLDLSKEEFKEFEERIK